jgi:hypothetical protein
VRDCGLTDPPARWHLDYQVHYDWCLAVAERFADSETRIREEQLRECPGGQPPGRPGPPTEADGDCECEVFDWVGKTTAEDDRVGREHNPNRDGVPDGRFNLTISCPVERKLIKLYLLGPPDQWGRRPQFDTDPSGPHYLGVWRNNQRLNPTDQIISDRIEGQARYELYAGDPNAFQNGNRYEITVTIEGEGKKQRLTCPSTVVAKRVPPTRGDRPPEGSGMGIPHSQERAGVAGEHVDEEAVGASESARPSFMGASRVYWQGWWILDIQESNGSVSGTIKYEKDPKRGKGTIAGEHRNDVRIGTAPPRNGIRGEIAMVREIQKWDPERRRPYTALVEHDLKRFQFRIEDETRLRGEFCTERRCFSAIGEKIPD